MALGGKQTGLGGELPAQPSKAARDLDTSPFAEPSYECRDCGRTDEHTYCIRWMERLHLWFTRRAES